MLGYLISRSQYSIRVFEPLFAGIYSVPIILFLPLYILFFGLGPASKIALGVTTSFFPIVLNTIAGFGYVERVYVLSARSMGATRGAILRVFFLSGASIGVVGTLLGFLLGLTFALNIDSIRLALESLLGPELWSAEIRFLSQLPARVEFGDVVSVVTMGLVLSFLATVYPAWRAARLDPVEALRYE